MLAHQFLLVLFSYLINLIHGFKCWPVPSEIDEFYSSDVGPTLTYTNFPARAIGYGIAVANGGGIVNPRHLRSWFRRDPIVAAALAWSRRPEAVTVWSRRPTVVVVWSRRPVAAAAWSRRPTVAAAWSRRPAAITVWSRKLTENVGWAYGVTVETIGF